METFMDYNIYIPTYPFFDLKHCQFAEGVAPFFDKKIAKVAGAQAEEAKFEAEVSGTPQPTIRWWEDYGKKKLKEAYLLYSSFKVYLYPKKKIDMWKGHRFEVHCTNIQWKLFIR